MVRLSFAASDAIGEVLWEEEVRKSVLAATGEDVDEEEEADTEEFNLWTESKLLLQIALPAVAVQFSVLFIFPQTAAMVGTVLGTNELAGFSLGSLVGNLTCLSVMVGALTAADTLMPRAFAAERYSEVGRLAIRGFAMCAALLVVPIIPLCTVMEWIFDALGQDEYASHLASEWIKVYLIGVPGMLLFRVVQSFLNSQHKVMPLVYASVFACFVFHPLMLNYLIPKVGFLGSGLAISLTQYAMCSVLLLYLWFNPVYKEETWPGISKPFVMESLSPRPMLTFLSLSMGGVLSLSEWWFWETVCFIVGSFGVVPLCVHTIAYNLVPLLFMIPLGIMIGLTVRMGHVIAHDVKRAKLLASWCMLFTTILGAIVAGLLFQFRVQIAMLFTNDEAVIQGCKDIWPKLCIYIFVLYIFGINSAILRALGMQWHMAAIIFGCLWLGTLPALIYFAIRKGGGIDAVWSTLPVFYVLMQFLLAGSYITADWTKIGNEINDSARKSIAMTDATVAAAAKAATDATETTKLLGNGPN